eukprot:Tbor_TRINITY_DN6179_c0_g2::TRINITY_DN6179_c0_g2_i1::g.22833::m.22833/K03033/PSMD3, RPN3; 26S proteasome regulatory subunit N3
MTAAAVTFSVPQLLDHLLALSLRHDELGQEIVLNEILRQLLERKEFEQSERIIANCELKQPYRSTNQAARFFYYVALTHATRLDYVSANHCISQALRKAPASHSKGILGFRIAATKLFLTIQLLLGEIPARSEFISDPAMKEALAPYMQLTSCVRFGNLGRFLSLLKQHNEQLEHDRTITLISRVRQNVIKTGLRRICQAYCRISLSDICVKLALENPSDAEYIVGKAIRDGVVEATIDHDSGTVTTSESIEVYNTTMEPLQAFQRRVQFLNTTHEEAIRAMRYVENESDQDKKNKESLVESAEVPEEDVLGLL